MKLSEVTKGQGVRITVEGTVEKLAHGGDTYGSTFESPWLRVRDTNGIYHLFWPNASAPVVEPVIAKFPPKANDVWLIKGRAYVFMHGAFYLADEDITARASYGVSDVTAATLIYRKGVTHK